jgi:hypothetical protein
MADYDWETGDWSRWTITDNIPDYTTPSDVPPESGGSFSGRIQTTTGNGGGPPGGGPPGQGGGPPGGGPPGQGGGGRPQGELAFTSVPAKQYDNFEFSWKQQEAQRGGGQGCGVRLFTASGATAGFAANGPEWILESGQNRTEQILASPALDVWTDVQFEIDWPNGQFQYTVDTPSEFEQGTRPVFYNEPIESVSFFTYADGWGNQARINFFADDLILENIDVYVNDGGTWTRAKQVYVKQNGQWQITDEAYVNDGGTWIQVIEQETK